MGKSIRTHSDEEKDVPAPAKPGEPNAPAPEKSEEPTVRPDRDPDIPDHLGAPLLDPDNPR